MEIATKEISWENKEDRRVINTGQGWVKGRPSWSSFAEPVKKHTQLLASLMSLIIELFLVLLQFLFPVSVCRSPCIAHLVL